MSVSIAAPRADTKRDRVTDATPIPARLNLADYMFGPPPHNRIDPGLRCWTRCPKPRPPVH